MVAAPANTSTSEASVDAFILFNDKEDTVLNIVKKLELKGVSTYFWRRDIPVGEPWSDIEKEILRYASKNDADAIFLNADDRLGERKLDILRHAPTPIMIVPAV